MTKIPLSQPIEIYTTSPQISTGKSSQSCPLALLAQTCSKIAPNLVSSVSCATTSSSSSVFQLNASSHGSAVKIAPAPSLPKDSKNTQCTTLRLSNDQSRNPNVRSQLTRVIAGQNSKESSFVPMVTPVKIPLTLVGPFYACFGAAGQVPMLKTSPKSDFLITQSTQTPNLQQTLQNSLNMMASPTVTDLSNMNVVFGSSNPITVATPGNSTAIVTESQQKPFISILPPEALTAKMLQAVPPCQQQITNTPQTITVQSTNDTIQTCKAKNTSSKDNATVQITVPPNTTPESLRQILILATQTAQKFQNARKSSPMLIQGQVDTSSNKLCNLKTTIPVCPTNSVAKTVSARNTNATPRKVRTPCRCPNCIKLKTGSGKNPDPKKRLHVCYFKDCKREFTKTSHLRAHIRTHTGERPYVCDLPFCDRKFTRSDELLRHRRTHGGVKKFKCHLCSKMFMRSDHLTKHRETHAKYHNRFAKTGSDKQH